MKGKDKCQLLKAIRRQIAERYGLEYRSEECHHKGECAGTCPRCDAELKDLQWQLEEKGIRDIDLNETMRDKVDKFIQPSVRDEEDNRILQGDVMPPQGSLRLEGMPALPEDRLPAGIPAVPPETGGFVIDDNNNDDEKEDEEDNNEHPVDEDRYFSLPEYYHKIDVQPDNPKGAKAYGFMSENASCILTAYPIRPEDAMDYADEAGLIEGLHKSVDKNQALIEVGTGRTNRHKRYIYSIVKTLKENGVQYFVLLHLQRFAEKDLCVKAFYDEQVVTGQREALVYAMLKSDGTLDKLGGLAGWSVDPYDHNFKHDFLMNLSGKKAYANIKTEEDFNETMKKLMLDDFIGEDGNIPQVFDHIYVGQKILTAEEYFPCVERYLDLCNQFFDKRELRIIEKLKTLYAMES